MEGKFEWIIQNRHTILYPGDVAVILPGQTFQGENDFLDIGTLFWIHIKVDRIESNMQMVLGKWSGLSERESLTIGRILHLSQTPVLVKMKPILSILQLIQTELFQQQIGYTTRVNQLMDELLILIAASLRCKIIYNATSRRLSLNWSRLYEKIWRTSGRWKKWPRWWGWALLPLPNA